jgi:hypothetical protein
MNFFEKSIIRLIILCGVLLAIIQYIYNRSLWLDEAYLSLNIISKTHFELLKPLDYIQVSPILFLQIEKLFSVIIPISEFGLRLFPLICYLASLFLFHRMVKAVFENQYVIIFALSLFAFNATLIYFSNEVKQYITDVLVLTSVYAFILCKKQSDKNYHLQLGLIGAVGIFLSNVTPIVLFTAGVYLLYDIYRNKLKLFPMLIATGGIWACTFLVYYILFIHNHPSRTGQISEWLHYNSFLPSNPFKIEFYQFLWAKGSLIVFALFKFGNKGGMALVALMFAGLIGLIRNKQTGFLILTILPVLLHLFLSALRLYPFDLRLILYLAPCVIMLSSFGFHYLFNIFFALLKIERLKVLGLAVPLVLIPFMVARFPIKHIEIKKSIKFIERHIQEGDKVFVNGFAGIPFQYYREISFLNMDTSNIIMGRKDPLTFNEDEYASDNAAYEKEIGALSGRVWFLFTPIADEHEKMRFLKEHFKKRGKKIIKEFHAEESEVLLYDTGI